MILNDKTNSVIIEKESLPAEHAIKCFLAVALQGVSRIYAGGVGTPMIPLFIFIFQYRLYNLIIP